MDNQDPQAAATHLPAIEEARARWQRLRAAYRYANLASHHVLGLSLIHI